MVYTHVMIQLHNQSAKHCTCIWLAQGNTGTLLTKSAGVIKPSKTQARYLCHNLYPFAMLLLIEAFKVLYVIHVARTLCYSYPM